MMRDSSQRFTTHLADTPPELCKPSRRVSMGTENTFATCSSTEFDDTSKAPPANNENGEKPSDLLVKMIAREMMSAMMKNSITDEYAPTVDVSTLDLESLADLVAKSETEDVYKPDSALSTILRETLSEATMEWTTSERTKTSSSRGRSTQSSTGTFTSSSGTLSSSEFGGLSTGEQRKGSRMLAKKGRIDAPMDVWHPDFWNLDVEDTSTAFDSRARTLSSRETESAPSISEFIKTMEVIESDNSDADDSSVLSDISGLTGVFDDFSKNRATRSQKPEPTVETTSLLSRKKKKDSKVSVSVDTTPVLVNTSKSVSKKNKERAVSYCVRFAKVQVREYERILGDNPSSQGGASLSIGWAFYERTPLDIEDFEAKRTRYRSPSEMIMDRCEREKIARKWGFEDKDIAAVVRDLNKLRNQRRQTVNNLKVQKMEEAVEQAKRKVKRLLFLSSKKVETVY